ncbi:MAG: Stp1/IreP family PP2C-type Ser/Thr phosphatase [Gaiellaceae bacterium]
MRVASSHAGTDPGRKRRRNEDSYVIAPPLFAVADGMGGAQAGEVASGLAAGALEESGANGGGERRVTELIQEANRRVHHRATTDATTAGMGTTITAALVEPDGRVVFGHVGDSRAYLLRDDRLEQLTNDHTLVAELVRRGELSPGEAEVHPQRSVITRALGTDPDVDVDTFAVEAQPRDIFLICSDGLSSMVDFGELEDILRRHRDDLPGASRALIQAANRGGGEDNITAVLFVVDEGEGPTGAVEPDEETRELALQFDEEDTLHPEDAVAPPPPLGADDGAARDPAAVPAAVDTMVVPSSEIAAALATREEQDVPQAGLGRRLLALLVIVVLVGIIVVLVWWGLAR